MSGAAAAPPRGTVVGLHKKPEVPGERGLPKRPVPAIRVDADGVEGDFNRWRTEEKGGDPAYALLVLPDETLEALRQEGWPVRRGDLGENLTTRGLADEALAPPRRFRAGSVVFESSKACEPCDNLYLLPYVGRVRGAAFLRTLLGRRGWYARVVAAGEVRVGDPVEAVG